MSPNQSTNGVNDSLDPRSSDERGKTLADRLNIKVFNVNGHDFVTGLLWEPLEMNRSFMAEAREKGKRYGMDIVAIRETPTIIQAGFSPKNRGAFKGMYSFANVMADVLGDNTLAVFQLSENYYALFAVLDGGIVANSDIVGDRETIEAKQNSLRNMVEGTNQKWARLIAPPGFALDDETVDLESIINPRVLKRHHQMRQLTFGLSNKELTRITAVSAAAMLIVGGGMYAWHVHHQSVIEKGLEAQREKAIRDAMHMGQQQTSMPQLPHPWASIAPVDAVLDGCVSYLGQFPVTMGGWVLDTATCQANGTIGAFYKRSGNRTLNDFLNAATAYFHVQPIATDPNTGGVGGRVNITGKSDEATLELSAAQRPFISHFQRWGIDVPLVPADAPAVAPQNGQPKAPVPDWKTFSFTETSLLNPTTAMAEIPREGLRVTEIDLKFDPATSLTTWTTKGDLYVH